MLSLSLFISQIIQTGGLYSGTIHEQGDKNQIHKYKLQLFGSGREQAIQTIK